MNLHTGTPYRQRMVVGTSADASADIRDGGGAGAEPSPLSGTAAKLSSFAYAFYKFTRPHTMAGTFISIVSISLLGLQVDSFLSPKSQRNNFIFRHWLKLVML